MRTAMCRLEAAQNALKCDRRFRCYRLGTILRNVDCDNSVVVSSLDRCEFLGSCVAQPKQAFVRPVIGVNKSLSVRFAEQRRFCWIVRNAQIESTMKIYEALDESFVYFGQADAMGSAVIFHPDACGPVHGVMSCTVCVCKWAPC